MEKYCDVFKVWKLSVKDLKDMKLENTINILFTKLKT